MHSCYGAALPQLQRHSQASGQQRQVTPCAPYLVDDVCVVADGARHSGERRHNRPKEAGLESPPFRYLHAVAKSVQEVFKPQEREVTCLTQKTLVSVCSASTKVVSRRRHLLVSAVHPLKRRL